jgi:hypothetical protein
MGLLIRGYEFAHWEIGIINVDDAQMRPLPPVRKQPIAAPTGRSASWLAYVQETPLVFFQHKAGQATGGIGSSINSDSVGPNLRVDRRRVTVHDKFPMLDLTRQEWVADIEKIIAILVIQRHARSYPSMAEKVITNIR